MFIHNTNNEGINYLNTNESCDSCIIITQHYCKPVDVTQGKASAVILSLTVALSRLSPSVYNATARH